MLTIYERRKDECNCCFEKGMGYDCKFKGAYRAFLCGICMDKQIDHRMEQKDEAGAATSAKS